jgi:hypothetical protein
MNVFTKEEAAARKASEWLELGLGSPPHESVTQPEPEALHT